jgi:PWWP domain
VRAVYRYLTSRYLCYDTCCLPRTGAIRAATDDADNESVDNAMAFSIGDVVHVKSNNDGYWPSMILDPQACSDKELSAKAQHRASTHVLVRHFDGPDYKARTHDFILFK